MVATRIEACSCQFRCQAKRTRRLCARTNVGRSKLLTGSDFGPCCPLYASRRLRPWSIFPTTTVRRSAGSVRDHRRHSGFCLRRGSTLKSPGGLACGGDLDLRALGIMIGFHVEVVKHFTPLTAVLALISECSAASPAKRHPKPGRPPGCEYPQNRTSASFRLPKEKQGRQNRQSTGPRVSSDSIGPQRALRSNCRGTQMVHQQVAQTKFSFIMSLSGPGKLREKTVQTSDI